MNYITSDEWLPKSSDTALMDWTYLKRRLNKTETKTIDEREKKRFLREWMKMDQSYIDKILSF